VSDFDPLWLKVTIYYKAPIHHQNKNKNSQDIGLPDFARYARRADMTIYLNISGNGRIWRNLVSN
jgi:hypothetical protein